jgi:hypothetical protein
MMVSSVVVAGRPTVAVDRLVADMRGFGCQCVRAPVRLGVLPSALTSRISHIRPAFGGYSGNPLGPARMTMHINADSW